MVRSCQVKKLMSGSTRADELESLLRRYRAPRRDDLTSLRTNRFEDAKEYWL